MTPELRAAAERVNAYFEARRLLNAILRQEDNGVIDACRNVELRLADIRLLLAAIDPTEQPTDLAAAAWGTHRVTSGLTGIRAAHEHEQRHAPLTDEPSGVIPTRAGLDYLALRRQQHPKAAADA